MKSTKGFTLVEIIVTMALLTTALVGPVALVTRGLFDFSFAKNKLVALHLAQEGLELVRAIRENNVLCDAQNGATAQLWDNNPAGGKLNGTYELAADESLAMDCTPPGGGPAISFPTPNPTPRPNCTNPRSLVIDAAGFYHYGAGTPTGFTRCVTICSPPSNCGFTDDGDIPNGDQMEVISKVEWTERGILRDLTLQTRLYNWR